MYLCPYVCSGLLIENPSNIGPFRGWAPIVDVFLLSFGIFGRLRDFGSVWGLRGSILGVLGLHSGTFGGPLASILGALGVS